MSRENGADHFNSQPGNSPDWESEKTCSVPSEDYIMEELNVIQSRLKELEEDRELLYNITQQQKERITELSNRLNDHIKVQTIFVASGIIIIVGILLVISYFAF